FNHAQTRVESRLVKISPYKIFSEAMKSEFLSHKDKHIAVVGGGVAGATAAIHFAELGFKVSVIEKGVSLVNGPPICHLHAGGNLYREIS
ncbi:FAD-dependent oxidoreductase, partial [Escherichia coli]|nr:FAD-dependent oxidoreductase [Escherichia coli]